MTMTALSSHVTLSLSRRSLASEWRALRAVFRREWIIFRRYPTWIIALFVWPAIFPAAYILSARALSGPDGSGLALFNQATGISDYLGFIAVGTTIWMWQNVVLWNVGFALRNDQLRGTLESNWLSPTWRFSFLLGSSILQLLTMLVFLSVAALEFTLFFGVRLTGNPGLALLMLAAAMPSIYGLGFAFASLVITAKEANAFVFLVRGLVMIFCGITFPITILPGWMQTVAAWLPPTYIIRGMRNAVLVGADLPALLPDLLPLVGFGLVWLLIGYTTFNWMERRARRTGAIGQY
ncbi:MAG TPA: ABC transporter permease [Anaerolineae bacterium]|nr:ABC transporter permease [Anaerolineae bacterium]